jgi:nickel/cobalt exporter
MGRRSTRTLVGLALALALAALPSVALAHPLGNFTINHYAGITVGPTEITLDVVIDMAEIPAFQERQRIDADGDGEVSDTELASAGPAACAVLASSIELAIDGRPTRLMPSSAAMSFPPGLGGLATMRLECGYGADVELPMGRESAITFADQSYSDRIGWREVVASGDGAQVTADGLPATSPSTRLTAYPEDLLSEPLDIRSATIVAVPDNTAPGPVQSPGAAGAVAAAIPGGIGGELPDIFKAVDLTPLVLLVSIATALALGAGHALTPGHGKTLMAAYFVGTRGTPLHAVGLGLAVTVSHTLGILVLASLVVGAQEALPPDVVVRTAPVIAAATIVAIGGWMLIGEVRRRRAAARSRAGDAGHAHGHPPADAAGLHSHGGIRHSHVPSPGSTIGWRGLFALGLAGGLIPSTSALFILLGSIVAGRPAFGFVLVVVFGLGMALVMTGVGLAMVVARERLDRLPSGSSLGGLARNAPLVAAVVVLAFGVYLSLQAIGGRPLL